MAELNLEYCNDARKFSGSTLSKINHVRNVTTSTPHDARNSFFCFFRHSVVKAPAVLVDPPSCTGSMRTKSVQVNGLLDPGFHPEGGRLIVDLRDQSAARDNDDGRTVAVEDARALQEASESAASFFEEHGFVLLKAPTAVTKWDLADGEIESLYFVEVDALAREMLFPWQNLEVAQSKESFLQRGVGTDNPNYATGVHQDYGWHAWDFQEMVAAFVGWWMGWGWRLAYWRPWVRSFTIVNFWRTTNMKDPLAHMPLMLCDPRSVRTDDLVRTGFLGIAPSGKATNQMSLRFHDDQRWYWYPAVAPDEVLVFKTFECRKDDPAPKWRTVFHSAFEDPDAPPDAEKRKSCEHRVGIFHLR